jgi:(E)-4-hydroxy-3-methylbut-2-enyl-diphosphate synthase
VADIHIDYRLALAALDSGVDAIRINPGNIGNEGRSKRSLKPAKPTTPRFGSASTPAASTKRFTMAKTSSGATFCVESAAKHTKILEDLGFYDIVLSLKGSDVRSTIAAYRSRGGTF